MRDVAAAAGVSPVVVSKVLHNKAQSVRVGAATAERVRRSAEELGYRCNVFARQFREQRTMQIGVVHNIGSDRPRFSDKAKYFSVLMDGIVEGAFAHGYSVTLCPGLLSKSPDDAMADGRFDGLVLYSTSPTPSQSEMLHGCTVPLVILHSHMSDIGADWPTVICDNHQGIGLAIDHLAELGHKKIAFLTVFGWGQSESRERLEAFKSIRESQGYPTTPADIIDVSGSHDSLHRFLNSDFSHTGLICHNDELAGVAIEAAKQFGISVPDRLSIVGFDSTSYCLELTPNLTSVSQPLFEMGCAAIFELMKVISDRSHAPEELVIPCGFDSRSSTTSVPEKIRLI